MFKIVSRKRILFPLIALAVVLALFLVALASGVFSSSRALTATPTTKAIPVFETADAVSGWARSTEDLTAAGNSVGYNMYREASSSCTYTTATYKDGIYYQNRSDFWISKDVLYGSASQNGTLVAGETATQLKVQQGGSLQFATAHWGVKTVDRKTSAAVWMAARAIDTPYTLPESVQKLSDPSNNGFGLDSSKAIPVLIAAYQCSKPSDASKAEFQTLLEATSVNLK